MSETLVLEDRLPREQTGAPCPCNGYADRVDATAEDEAAGGGCGRIGCCCAAFVCRLCGRRLVARLEAPEIPF